MIFFPINIYFYFKSFCRRKFTNIAKKLIINKRSLLGSVGKAVLTIITTIILIIVLYGFSKLFIGKHPSKWPPVKLLHNFITFFIFTDSRMETWSLNDLLAAQSY